jgi:hypothetical protein
MANDFKKKTVQTAKKKTKKPTKKPNVMNDPAKHSAVVLAEKIKARKKQIDDIANSI